jgi:hypothetical protein
LQAGYRAGLLFLLFADEFAFRALAVVRAADRAAGILTR